jgi:hypothetical protein
MAGCRRWKDNIKMGLRELIWKGVDSIFMAKDRENGGLS